MYFSAVYRLRINIIGRSSANGRHYVKQGCVGENKLYSS